MTIVVVLIAVSWVATYAAGGTKTPVPHAFYIPIIVASGAFGIRAGLIAGLLAGFVCGPLMPLNVATGEAQSTSGWLIRLGFFVAIAALVGLGRNRLIELSGARQRFLSIVSHELRTPLSSVVGFSSVLVDQADKFTGAETKEFAGLILKEATEMANVVDHYIIEGRMDDDALFIETAPTDLRKVIEIVLNGLPPHVVDKRVRVSGGDIVCLADPLRLRQVFRSMVNNALAYTPSNLHIAVTAENSTGRVRITDEGSQKGGSNVLTAISEISTRTTTPTPPLGIGLSVSRDLVRLMGGDLHYEVSGATSYDLQLPLAVGAAMQT